MVGTDADDTPDGILPNENPSPDYDPSNPVPVFQKPKPSTPQLGPPKIHG